MGYITLVFCIISTVAISEDIPIPCTTQVGGFTPGTSTVSCGINETMVSCGTYIYGGDAIVGTVINTTTNTCTAYLYNASSYLEAVARCCEFPTEAAITTSTTTSATGTNVSAECPSGSILTGCSYKMIDGDANEIQGAYSGDQSSPPQTAEWITTSDTCNAATTGAPNTVEAVARCLTFGDTRYELVCETKANFTHYAYFGGCETGKYMMGCNAFSTTGDLYSFWVDPFDTCYTHKDGDAKLYANAICCQLVLTTFTPTQSPSLNPSASTLNPSASTLNPSASPTLYPTASPSRNPSASTLNPSVSPTLYSSTSSEDSGSASDDSDSDSDDEVFLNAADANVADVDAFVAKKYYDITIALSDEIVAQLSLMAAIMVISNIVMCCLCKT